MKVFRIKFCVIFLCADLVGGCALRSVETDPFAIEGKSWPDPHNVPRIAYVGEFSKASDLSIGESFWRAIINLTAGAPENALVRPMAVAATADGKTIYVADPDAKCVHQYDIGRGRYRCLTIGDDTTLSSPIGLTIMSGGRLLVSDSQLGRLFQVAPGGKELEQFETSLELDQPTGIHWDAGSERLYIADTGRQAVLGGGVVVLR